MFNDFEECEYKQLVVELFCVMAAILKRNPELEFTENVDSTAIIDDAIRMFKVVRTLNTCISALESQLSI